MGPGENAVDEQPKPEKRGDKLLFWRVFWSLAGIEAVGLTWWFRERFSQHPVGTLLIVTLVPVLIFGHFNVFPASLAARVWRRRHRVDAD